MIVIARGQIVVVEDCPLHATVLREILGCEYDVLVVSRGLMATKVIESKKPNLVMLDLTLPDIHGLEVLKILQAHADSAVRKIPVIIITGDDSDDSAEKGLALGAANYILKPFNQSLLKLQVRNQLEIIKSRDNLQGIIQSQTAELQNIHSTLVYAISLLVGERDGSTGEHVSKVVRYMRVLMNQLGLAGNLQIPDDDKEYVVAFSSLHDIGKIAIQDSVLLKSAALNSEEFELMKTHTTNGASLLRRVQAALNGFGSKIEYAIDMAEFHHEKFNGTGYPQGLKGEEIPFAARMLHICDVYDAITSKRHYKSAASHSQAMEIIINGDGRTEPTHFDPVVLEGFICTERDFEEISMAEAHT